MDATNNRFYRMTDQEAARHGLGGNQPPAPLTPGEIAAGLQETYAGLLQRRDELIAAVETFVVECPKIEDDDEQAAATDNLEIIRLTLKEVKQRHKDEKEPFLKGGKAVDTFFGTLSGTIEAARDKLHAVANAYADRLREARKRQAEEVARIRTEQAERLIAEMDRGGSLEAARIAAEEAETAARLAASGAHAHTLTTGNYGTKSAQYERWAWKITDPDAVPREYCSPDPVKLNAAVKDGFRKIPGLEIFLDRKLRTRS